MASEQYERRLSLNESIMQYGQWALAEHQMKARIAELEQQLAQEAQHAGALEYQLEMAGERLAKYEQQLAQAQENVELWCNLFFSTCKERDTLLEEKQQLREKAQERYEALQEWEAQARALLEALAKDRPVAEDDADDCWYCVYCDGEGFSAREIDHSSDCPWLRAGAFLAREEANGGK